MSRRSYDQRGGIMDDGNLVMSHDSRKASSCNKPLLEKRRRARINRSLDQLKLLLLQSSAHQPVSPSISGSDDTGKNFSKLEKADVLELAVEQLRILQKQRNSIDDGDMLMSRYEDGFAACVAEVGHYFTSVDVVPQLSAVLPHLVNHLAACLRRRSRNTLSAATVSDTRPRRDEVHGGDCEEYHRQANSHLFHDQLLGRSSTEQLRLECSGTKQECICRSTSPREVGVRPESCPAVQAIYTRSAHQQSPVDEDSSLVTNFSFISCCSDTFISKLNVVVDSASYSSKHSVETDSVWRPW